MTTLRRVAAILRQLASHSGDYPLELRREYSGQTVETLLRDYEGGEIVVYWGLIPRNVLEFVL